MENWIKYTIIGLLILCIYLWYNKYNTKVINILGNGKSLKKF